MNDMTEEPGATGMDGRSAEPAEEREPFIPYAEPEHVRPDLLSSLRQYEERMGFTPNALKLYLHRPHLLKAIITLNNTVMRHESNVLSEEFKYRLAFIVSRNHGCRYCCAHHAATLKGKFGLAGEDLKDVLHLQNPQDEREAVAWDFVDRASRGPQFVTDEVRSRLADHFTCEEIIEIVAVLGFWAMYNRIHANLDVPIERHLLPEKGWVDVGREGTLAEGR